MDRPKVGDRVMWTRRDYGSVVFVSDKGTEYMVKWDEPDPDTGEDIVVYDYTNTASGVSLAKEEKK